MFQLLVEDIIEEVEMLVEEEQGKLPSQEREEKLEEQGQEHPRKGASSDQPPLEALEALAALQVELSSPNEKDPTAYLRLQRKDRQRRKCPLSQRSAIIQGIPGLWAKAVSLVSLLRGPMLRRTRMNRSRRRGRCQGICQLTERAPRELVGKGIGHQGSCDFHSRSASTAYESFYLYMSEQMSMEGSVWPASE